MGKYRRIPRAPSSAIAAQIGHPPHTPTRRAAKGARVVVPSPTWSPGRRGAGGFSIPVAAASISSSRTGIGQAVHNSSRSVDIPDSFKSRSGVYDHSNSPYTHAAFWEGSLTAEVAVIGKKQATNKLVIAGGKDKIILDSGVLETSGLRTIWPEEWKSTFEVTFEEPVEVT
jgi:hypothetical protein